MKKNNGKVGINTTTPARALTIQDYSDNKDSNNN